MSPPTFASAVTSPEAGRLNTAVPRVPMEFYDKRRERTVYGAVCAFVTRQSSIFKKRVRARKKKKMKRKYIIGIGG